MTAQEISNEIDGNVERIVNSNTDMKDFAGVIARGIWQLALQVAKLNGNFEESRKYHEYKGQGRS